MKKAAVIVAPGMEEAEAVTILDVLRRAGVDAKSFGLEKEITGGHGITVQCDEILNPSILDVDAVILPGGYGGVDAMMENQTLLSFLQTMNENKKIVAAMCAAPAVLEKAGLLTNREYTAYRGYDEKIKEGKYLDAPSVRDGNIITGQGPARVYEFSYMVAEALMGKETAENVKNRMAYYEERKV